MLEKMELDAEEKMLIYSKAAVELWKIFIPFFFSCLFGLDVVKKKVSFYNKINYF